MTVAPAREAVIRALGCSESNKMFHTNGTTSLTRREATRYIAEVKFQPTTGLDGCAMFDSGVDCKQLNVCLFDVK